MNELNRVCLRKADVKLIVAVLNLGKNAEFLSTAQRAQLNNLIERLSWAAMRGINYVEERDGE